MDVIYAIVEFFVQGGIFMYPILLVFAVGVAVAVERYVTLTLLTRRNQTIWAQVQPLLAKREFDKARELTANNEATVAQLLSMGLERQGGVEGVSIVVGQRRGETERSLEADLEVGIEPLAGRANDDLLAGFGFEVQRFALSAA